MGSFELSDRARRLLVTLVREYIETGEAVSSHVLARASGLGVSSATVRNVLVQLEEAGYLHQPHTSAGRVPTDRGYRVFVDLLLESRKPARPSALVESQLRQQADRSPFVDDLLASVSHLVSKASRQVGFALAAAPSALLHRIEFVPLGGSRVLVVVVARGNQVTQKVIDAGETLDSAELVQAANYLNTEFAGLPLFQVREAVCARLQQERTLYDELLSRALRLARNTLEELSAQTFHVEGAAALLDGGAHEGVSMDTLRALLEMMDEKERLVHLLNQYIDGAGLTIVIGAEHSSPDLRHFSLVASTAVDQGAMRTVGIIGPMRMHYSRAISVVDGTMQVVARVLRHPN
jgi:heat-inducible transcriptional repressor